MSRWSNEPAGFNAAAAETVYRALVKMDDDAAVVFGRILVGDAVRHELVTKRVELVKAMDSMAARNATALRSRLSRTAVAKSRSGSDSTPELQVLALIAKADHEYKRDTSGHFAHINTLNGSLAEAHQRIAYDPDFKPLRHKVAATSFGIPHPGDDLGNKDVGRYQQAYAQIAETLRDFRHGMNDTTIAHLHLHDKDGNVRTEHIGMPKKGEPFQFAQHLKPGEHVHSVSVSASPPMSAGGAMYDAMAAAGAPRMGAKVGGTVDSVTPERLHALGDHLKDGHTQDDYIPSNRIFRNLEHGSKFLDDSFGDVLPTSGQYALKVGQQVGRLGPEAQRVIGPSADKAAYRYRGTERPVSQALGANLTSIARNPNIQDKREYLLHGAETPEGTWSPSGVMRYFRTGLPKVEHNELQLKSGVVPPSRGIIITDKGQVHSEAVGHGDDWYLPFNLKNLRSLKGGEYIRTRTFGGPTTEDLYTGLMSGARSMTVVSHNGVYTIDLDNDLRGGRRFNDKAARMVGRYGHLLDAVKSEQVDQAGIHPSRLAELEDQAGQAFDEEREPERYAAELNRLKTRERKPGKAVLSQSQRADASLDFFNDLAAKMPRATDRDGNVAQVHSTEDLVDTFVVPAANKKRSSALANARTHGFVAEFTQDPRNDLGAYVERERAGLQGGTAVETAERTADALGVRAQYDRAMDDATKANQAALSPLRLDGEGYKTALDALQEQFPQYIANVQFHRWDDASSARDTGYVRPRHNRAAAALSGYFGEGISRVPGRTKVRADSTRYQNRRETPVDYARAERKKPDEARTETRAADISPEVARGLENDAVREFVADLRSQSAIGREVNSPSGAGLEGAKGVPARQALSDPGFAAQFPAIAKIHDPGFDFDSMLSRDREGALALASRAKTEQQRHKVFDGVNLKTLRNFENGGRPEPLAAKPAAWSEALDSLDTDRDLGLGHAYSARDEPSAHHVRGAYATNPRISRLATAGELPASVDSTDFGSMARSLREKLLAERRVESDRARKGMVARPEVQRALNDRSEGLAHAMQLRRRLDEARVQQVSTAPAAPVENHYTVVGPDSVEEWLRAGGLNMGTAAPGSAGDDYRRGSIDA